MIDGKHDFLWYATVAELYALGTERETTNTPTEDEGERLENLEYLGNIFGANSKHVLQGDEVPFT